MPDAGNASLHECEYPSVGLGGDAGIGYQSVPRDRPETEFLPWMA